MSVHQSSEQDENVQQQHYTKSPLYKAFLPILYSLKVGGLYYERDSMKRSSKFTLFYFLYSFTVLVIMWASFIVNLYPLKDVTKVDQYFLSTIYNISSSMYCATNVTCLISASCNQKAFGKFFKCLCSRGKYGGTHYINPVSFKKVVSTLCIFNWLLFILVVTWSLYFSIGNNLFIFVIPKGFLTNKIAYYLLQIFATLYLIYVTYCALFTNCLLLTIGIAMYTESKQYRISLLTKLNESGSSQVTIENERKRYVEMTRFINAADCTWSVRLAATFGLNVIDICVMLYVVLYNPDIARAQSLLIPYVFWLITCVSDMSVACISGILITSAVSLIESNYLIYSLS